MAKRKRHRTTKTRSRRSLSAAPRRRRRRSGLSAGVGSMFSNPLVGAAVGATAAGLIGGFLSKPGTDGKPFIESPMLRAAAVGVGVFIVGKVLKAPAIGVGGVAVATFAIVKNAGFLSPAQFNLADGAEINYVNPALLSDPSTLADSYTLANYGGPYSATRY